MSERQIPVYRDLMGANDEWAAQNRLLLEKSDTRMINLIGSPGAGKTALLQATVSRLSERYGFGILEGDVETTNDAERLNKLHIPVSQLLTGGSCHLEAKLVHYALKDLAPENLDVVFVENVGNLVCPAEFDIGETAKVAVVSITEGEDKPEKYPLLFQEASAVVVTKTDLLPYLAFDMDRFMDCLRSVNGAIPILQVAAGGSEPQVDVWLEWLQTCTRGTEQGVA